MRILSILFALLSSTTVFAQVIEVDSLLAAPVVYQDPAGLLKGQVAGVRVSSLNGTSDETMRVDIRGINGLRAESGPLWIIDGTPLNSSPAQVIQPFFQYGDSGYLPMTSGLSGMHIYDIRSIEILKNASATALYGSRGANGVVIIKTRMAEKERLEINVNTNVGIGISEVTADGITPAVQHCHNISVGSKGKSSHFRVSAFFRDTDGVYKGTGRQSYGSRASFGAKKSDVITFGGNIGLHVQQAVSPASAVWYGAPSLTISSRGIAPLSYNDPQNVTSVNGWMSDYDNRSKTLRTIDDIYFNVRFAPGFYWRNSAGLDFQNITRNIWYGNGTAFGKESNGVAAVITSSLLNLDVRSVLEYSRYINTLHNVSARLAFEYITQKNRWQSMTGADFFSHELRSNALAFMQSKAVIRHFTSAFSNPAASVSLHYDYKSLLGADLNARYDTYLEYDRGTDFLDSLYPSVQVYADLRGLLLPDSSKVSSLRLEGGYGITGTRNFMPYNTFSIYANGGYPQVADDLQAYYKGVNKIVANEWHAAVRTGFINEMISFSATYYERLINDRLLVYCNGKPKSEDVSTWISAPMSMVSSHESHIMNRGVELSVDAFAFRNRKSSLEISLNAAYNFNNVAQVAEEDSKGLYLNSYDMYATVNKKGYPVSSIYGYTLDADNVVNGEGVLGSTIPVLTGGLDVRLRLGNFCLEAMADWACGHRILNMNRMLASGQEYVSEVFVEKGDYLRLARLCALYGFKFNNKWIRSLNISLSADNLLTATSYSGWNPDVNSFGYTNMAYGLDYGSCPLVRSIVLGLAVKF